MPNLTTSKWQSVSSVLVHPSVSSKGSAFKLAEKGQLQHYNNQNVENK